MKALGVRHTFGIPGDFVLPLYQALERTSIRPIVVTHEPAAGFAAAAYARIKGLGVALVTYGAGALNMVNAIAQAYAQRSPVLVVSGAPEIHDRHLDADRRRGPLPPPSRAHRRATRSVISRLAGIGGSVVCEPPNPGSTAEPHYSRML